jgi:hypothetical protein
MGCKRHWMDGFTCFGQRWPSSAGHHKPQSTHTHTHTRAHTHTHTHTHKSTHNTDDILWRNTTIAGIHSKILTNWKIVLILTMLSPSVIQTRKLACNTRTYEAFSLKCLSHSDNGHHCPKHVKASFYYWIRVHFFTWWNLILIVHIRYAGICQEDLRNLVETLVRIAGGMTENRIPHLQNTSQEYDLRVCDDSTLIQLLTFWTLSILLLFMGKKWFM